MRCGWVNNSKPSPRAMAASVIPAASAVRIASAGRRRYGDDQRRADNGGLLHHLHRHAAREKHHAAAQGNRAARQSSGELVERIVTADIFAQCDEARVRTPEGRGMHGARLAIEFLARAQRLQRLQDLRRRKARLIGDAPAMRARPLRGFRSRTGRNRSVPPGGGGVRSARRRGARRATCAIRCRPQTDDVELPDVGRRSDDAFGEAETQREIVEIFRRRHHDGVGATVVAESDRRLLPARGACRPPHPYVATPRCRPRPPASAWCYSAASTVGDAPALARQIFVLFLPLGRTVRGRHLHRRHLVFRAIGRPVGIVRRDHVRLRARMMEGRVDDARRHALR